MYSIDHRSSILDGYRQQVITTSAVHVLEAYKQANRFTRTGCCTCSYSCSYAMCMSLCSSLVIYLCADVQYVGWLLKTCIRTWSDLVVKKQQHYYSCSLFLLFVPQGLSYDMKHKKSDRTSNDTHTSFILIYYVRRA